MTGWTLFEMHRELTRQRGRLIDLLWLLDDKNLAKQQDNEHVLQRRRVYVLKNNGKGRPPLKLQRASQEDEARREKYVAEIALIDQWLAYGPLSVRAGIRWLEEVRKNGSAAREKPDYRRRKIDKLLAQFAGHKIPARPGPAEGPRPWDKKEVLEVLGILQDLQEARTRAVDHSPVRTLGEQDRQDAEHAHLDVLRRVVAFRRLGTANGFLHEARSLRDVVVPPQPAHDQEHYAACWRSAVEEIIARLRLDFRMEP